MMKVICIDAKPIKGAGNCNLDLIEEGKVYKVKLSFTDCDGNLAYILIEVNNINGYIASRFIPLSTIDETEMERNYNTVKI